MVRQKIRSRLASQEGQVLSWVLRIFLVALVIGFLITQCGPVIANHITIKSMASEAADYAARVYQDHHGDTKRVTMEVERWLLEREARLAGDISIDYDQFGKADTIYVPVRRIRNTYIFKNVGYLSPYAEAYSEGEGSIFQ